MTCSSLLDYPCYSLFHWILCFIFLRSDPAAAIHILDKAWSSILKPNFTDERDRVAVTCDCSKNWPEMVKKYIKTWELPVRSELEK